MKMTSSINLWIGAVSGAAVAVLSASYVAVLVVGLLAIQTPGGQIPDPWFTFMELLILLLAPSMVLLSIAVQSWVPDERRVLGTIAVVFFSICAAITMSVHLVVLVASRNPLFSDPTTMQSLFSFQWPSVAYVLDILAWDVAFPVGAFAAAVAIPGSAGIPAARILLFCSAVLAFTGLVGVPLNDMWLRNIGILGYAFLFPIAAGILSVAFLTTARKAMK
jgi:hypothetical protein